jgi:hypothetical protein
VGALTLPRQCAADNSAFNNGTPPDTTGAIGPADYVEFVNTVVADYNRDTLALVGSKVQGDTFMGFTGHVTFDVQMQWDEQGQRWFYLADDCGTDPTCATANSLDFGWSKTSDPAGMDRTQWCHYGVSSGSFQSHPLFDDFPKLGHDDNHLIFGTNVFGGASGADFETARIWSVPKPAAGVITTCPTGFGATQFGSPGNPLQITGGSTAFTPVPANTADGSTVGYVVAADYPAGDLPGPKDQVMVWEMGGTSTAPTLTADGNVSVGSYDIPAPAPDRGSFTIDTQDARLTQAVALNDPSANSGAGAEAVWTQHTVDGPGGRSVVRWYELIPSLLTAQQEGTVSDPSAFAFNGAISPSASGGAGILYNMSSSVIDPQIRARARISSAPAGDMSGEVILQWSAAPDQDFSCDVSTPCRWGDYAGASPDPDPTHTNLVWASNQWLGPPRTGTAGNPHWRTCNFAIETDTTSTPAPCFDNPPVAVLGASQRSVAQGQAVTFNASGSRDPEGPVADYKWDLDGNGSFETDTGTSPTATMSYASAGVVAVTVRVADSKGQTADAAVGITVNAPPAAPAPATPDTTPPILRLTFKKVQKLRTVLKKGVAGKARCSEACTSRFQLQLTRKTAKKLHISARFVTVGKLTKRLAANRTTSVHIKLSRKARKRLAHIRRVTLRLSVRATDAASNTTKTITRVIILKR